MKITRKQLRKMINESILLEHRIKPSIPGLESDDHIENIDTLARGEDTRDMSDVMADTFGYSGSYSSDLHDYDNISPLRMTIMISPFVSSYNPGLHHLDSDAPVKDGKHEVVIPHNMVDELIEEYNSIQSYDVSGLIVTARKIEKHIMADINYHYPNHVIDGFTPEIKGYRAEEFKSAWYEVDTYYSVGGR